MADEPRQRAPMGRPAEQAPETQDGRRAGIDVSMGEVIPAGQKGPQVHKEPDHGVTAEVDPLNPTVKKANEGGEVKAPAPEGEKKAPVEGETPAPEAAAKPEALKDLPAEFKADDAPTVEKYTKAFISDDGKLNMANLSADWQQHAKVDDKGNVTGQLSDGTYAFLESKGISKEMAQQVEAGQAAQVTLARNAIFTKAGGEQPYMQATEWARTGGYTKEARDAFNAALAKGGSASTDAVDLLMSRFRTANPPARRQAPAITAADAGGPAGGSGGGDPAVAPYANYAEYQKDLRTANANKDQTLFDKARARLKASQWYGGNKQ